MANILRNVDKIITSAPASKEIDLNNIQAAGGGNQVMTITTTNDGGGNYHFNRTITFSVTGTSALAGQSITKLEYAWDGGSKTVIANSNTGTFTHMETTLVTYASNPSYTEMHVLSLTATDSLGNTFTKDYSLNFTLPPLLQATGGTITEITDANGQDWRVHTFTSTGNFDVTYGGQIEYVVVAGGGGGGGHAWGGGGGAGGFLSSCQSDDDPNYSIHTPIEIPIGTHLITVGGGGDGGDSSSYGRTSGSPSSIGTLVTALGGGYGGNPAGYDNLWDADDGGSGGGASYGDFGVETAGQGNHGGTGDRSNYAAGGGGGAGGAGVNGSGSQGGNGGVGAYTKIRSTTPEYFAGGGGGGHHESGGAGGAGGTGGGSAGAGYGTYNASHATINTGGGGGGAGGRNGINPSAGGNGGDGIVIIRYRK